MATPLVTSGSDASLTGGRVLAQSRPIAALAAAAGVGGCLVLATRGGGPLPATPWAAAFLTLAIYLDVSSLRLPNWLTLPALAAALGGGAVAAGAAGFSLALQGAGVALAVLFIPFARRWLGAGDVKACMVLGALWGPAHFLGAFWWMILAGGTLALSLVAVRGDLLDLGRRWLLSLRVTLRGGKLTYFGPDARSSAARGLPFAVAMGLGAVAYQAWGLPWV